jgi:hypothetical protein
MNNVTKRSRILLVQLTGAYVTKRSLLSMELEGWLQCLQDGQDLIIEWEENI